MDHIPVKFTYLGKEYSGTLDELGAGRDQWQLMVGGYYRGRLRRVNDTWYFDESNWPIAHLKDDFVAVVISWYE